MDMLKTIFERRSIRKYTGEPVSRDQLLTLAKAGMAAPTSRDTRHFNFVIVDDEEIVNKLAEGLPYAKMLFTAKHAIVVISDLMIAHGGAETDYWAQDSSLGGVLEEAQIISRLLPDDPDVAEFVDLVQKANEIPGGQ